MRALFRWLAIACTWRYYGVGTCHDCDDPDARLWRPRIAGRTIYPPLLCSRCVGKRIEAGT